MIKEWVQLLPFFIVKWICKEIVPNTTTMNGLPFKYWVVSKNTLIATRILKEEKK